MIHLHHFAYSFHIFYVFLVSVHFFCHNFFFLLVTKIIVFLLLPNCSNEMLFHLCCKFIISNLFLQFYHDIISIVLLKKKVLDLLCLLRNIVILECLSAWHQRLDSLQLTVPELRLAFLMFATPSISIFRQTFLLPFPFYFCVFYIGRLVNIQLKLTCLGKALHAKILLKGTLLPV